MKKAAIIISPNYKDYAKKYLDDCLESLRKQDYQGEMKIFITDNESGDESFFYLKNRFEYYLGEQEPAKAEWNINLIKWEIIRNKNNDGYAKGCNDSIRSALSQNFDLIAIFNIHTILEPNCLGEMIKILDSDEKIGIVQARMMLWPEKDLISSLGNATHFLGFGYCDGYGGKTKPDDLKVKNIFYPSGSSILIKRKTLEEIGLFDEEFWMYNEDQDLGWRVWLAGYKCVLAPDAVMYNKYEFQRSIKKFYWMDRNRIIAIIKCYHILTLVLIFPAFVIMELGLILFSLKTGWFKEKMKVWRYFFTPAKWQYLYKARRQTQALRKVKDRDIIDMISGRIWYQEIDDVKLRLINPVFNLYWNIIKKIIWW